MQKKRLLSNILLVLFSFMGILALLAVYNFKWFLLTVNTLWLILFFSTILFTILGILTFAGKKKEAEKILNMILEGSITIIDVVDFVKSLLRTFVDILFEAIMITIPNLSYVISAFIYILILVGYKYVGLYFDVTLPTIILAFFITVFAGILTLPKPDATKQKDNQINKAVKKFKRNFVDSFEIVIFILFLTIDSTNLFFLPEKLNIPLRAEILDYDLMVRGFHVTDHFTITFQIAIMAIAIELIRQIIRITAVAKNFYKRPYLMVKDSELDLANIKQKELTKMVLNETVRVSKDDFLMFAAFNVFLITVFLLFPRLKLLALISASLAGLIMDLIFTQRLVYQENEDLMSWIFKKIVRD